MLPSLRAATAALLLLVGPGSLSAPSQAADLQTNLNFLQYGGEFPFLNLVSMCGDGWTYRDNSAHVPPNLYTSDNRGYPQIPMTGPAAYMKCPIPTQAARAGQYVIVWSNADTNARTGTHIGATNGNVAEFVPSSSSGTLTFTPTTADVNWIYPTLRGNIPAGFKLAIIHVNDLSAYQNGEIVGRQYRDRIKAGGFNGVRWMTVINTNVNQVVDASDLMPIDYASLYNAYVRPAIWAGTSSTSGRVVKVTPYSGFEKLDGAKISFRLDAALSGASPHDTASNQIFISVDGGTTQDPVRSNNGRPLWAPYGGTYSAGDIIYAVWDSLFGSWIVIGQNTAGGPVGSIHPDVVTQFHRELSAFVGWPVHIYYNVPGLAVDRKNADGSYRDVTDWIAFTVARFNAGLAGTSILPHYEMGNEVWNSRTPIGTWSFAREATRYPASSGAIAAKPELAYFGSYDWGNWLGRATSYAGRALDRAYGGDRTKYLFGPGVQQSYFRGSNYPSDGDAQSLTMLSPNLVSERGSTFTAKNWVNTAYISSYWTSTLYGTPAEQIAANNWSVATGSAKAAIVQNYADDNWVHSGLLFTELANFKAWSMHFGVSISLTYEGGYTPDYVGDGAVLDRFRRASKFVPTMRQWEALHVYQARAAGITRPSIFILGGAGMSWSVFEPDIYGADNTNPRWLGILDAGPASSKLFLRAQ